MTPYGFVFSPDAAAVRNALSAFLRKKLDVELLRLGGSPVQLSKPSEFPPYPIGFQVYEFETSSEGERHQFAVLFKYMPNEDEIWIHAIGHNPGQQSDA